MTFDTNKTGEFVRRQTGFRNWVGHDRSGKVTQFPSESGRYHLYVSLACPWAHRTVMMRKLKGLEDVIGLSIVDPVWNEQGWYFSDYPGAIQDSVNHLPDLISLYRLADPKFSSEETTPVLWDKETKSIVNNESAEIIRMLDLEFSAHAKNKRTFYPVKERAGIDAFMAEMYPVVNNGVYRAGFAKSQGAYERAVKQLFAALDHFEKVLLDRRYLCGDELTEADLCLFATLLRFDPVYVGHFKCNLKRIVDYPNLWGYTRDVYQTPGIAETCNLDHIKRHYYMSHPQINPTRIVPVGPEIDYASPHHREELHQRHQEQLISEEDVLAGKLG
ncbi:MAG: glutathione S-transferase family protein [Methylotenera sp.]|nr:glutathione S-transferase family protein [Oligoflexia bacterium]